MSRHERRTARSHEWLTPPAIIKALGRFDLDPCAPVMRPWPTAKRHYTIEDDGLTKKWGGLIWLSGIQGGSICTCHCHKLPAPSADKQSQRRSSSSALDRPNETGSHRSAVLARENAQKAAYAFVRERTAESTETNLRPRDSSDAVVAITRNRLVTLVLALGDHLDMPHGARAAIANELRQYNVPGELIRFNADECWQKNDVMPDLYEDEQRSGADRLSTTIADDNGIYQCRGRGRKQTGSGARLRGKAGVLTAVSERNDLRRIISSRCPMQNAPAPCPATSCRPVSRATALKGIRHLKFGDRPPYSESARTSPRCRTCRRCEPVEYRNRVFLNPPYGYGALCGRWLQKLAEHGNGIALVFARTETQMFHDHVWPRADAILFLKGRIHFLLPDGSRPGYSAGAPSVLIAYGTANAYALKHAHSGGLLEGALVRLRRELHVVSEE